MFRSIIIGNLGADAQVKNENGKQFVSFSVGHNDRWTDTDGNIKETTQWVSCALNGDGGKLLPYLKKGKAVYIEGRTTTRIYSSEKLRKMVAGVNVSVDHLELLGGQTEDVPRSLATSDGELHQVHKAYYIEDEEAKSILGKEEKTSMWGADGRLFSLVKGGWVAPVTNNERDAEHNHE